MTFNIRQDVFHRRRCLFWNGWFVVIRNQKVSERTQRTCEKSHPDSSRFLADIVRTLQVGTLGLCRACSSVQAISSELIALIVFFLRRLPFRRPLCRAFSHPTLLRRLHQQLDSRTCSFQTEFFFSSAVFEEFFFFESFDASRQAFLCHIVFRARFLETRCIFSHEENLLNFQWDCWSSTGSTHRQYSGSNFRTSWYVLAPCLPNSRYSDPTGADWCMWCSLMNRIKCPLVWLSTSPSCSINWRHSSFLRLSTSDRDVGIIFITSNWRSYEICDGMRHWTTWHPCISDWWRGACLQVICCNLSGVLAWVSVSDTTAVQWCVKAQVFPILVFF